MPSNMHVTPIKDRAKTVDKLLTVSSIVRMKKETGFVELQEAGKCDGEREATRRDDTYLMRGSVKDARKTSDAS